MPGATNNSTHAQREQLDENLRLHIKFINLTEQKMEKYLLTAISLLWVLTACSAAVTPALDVPTETIPTQTFASPTIKYYSLDTVTGNAELDVVLAAVAQGNPEDLIGLFRYTKTACKTVNALGGPPPCREGEAEGTVVEVLPFLGPEGSYLRKDEVANFPGLNVIGLLAIYRVPAAAFSDVNFPAGEYAIMYIGAENLPAVVLQITNGKIVRIDYIFVYPEYDEFLPKEAKDFVLPPLK